MFFNFSIWQNSAYELRSSNHFQRAKIQTEHWGSDSIKTLGVKVIIIIIEKKITNRTLQSCYYRLFRFKRLWHLSKQINFYIYISLNFMYPFKIHTHLKFISLLYNCSVSIYCKNLKKYVCISHLDYVLFIWCT